MAGAFRLCIDKQLNTGEAYRRASFRDHEENAVSIYELTK